MDSVNPEELFETLCHNFRLHDEDFCERYEYRYRGPPPASLADRFLELIPRLTDNEDITVCYEMAATVQQTIEEKGAGEEVDVSEAYASFKQLRDDNKENVGETKEGTPGYSFRTEAGGAPPPAQDTLIIQRPCTKGDYCYIKPMISGPLALKQQQLRDHLRKVAAGEESDDSEDEPSPRLKEENAIPPWELPPEMQPWWKSFEMRVPAELAEWSDGEEEALIESPEGEPSVDGQPVLAAPSAQAATRPASESASARDCSSTREAAPEARSAQSASADSKPEVEAALAKAASRQESVHGSAVVQAASRQENVQGVDVAECAPPVHRHSAEEMKTKVPSTVFSPQELHFELLLLAHSFQLTVHLPHSVTSITQVQLDVSERDVVITSQGQQLEIPFEQCLDPVNVHASFKRKKHLLILQLPLHASVLSASTT
ncbi:hypothetical protein CYMTET_11805 [Cymbomonas tetramitiformis]|uniref:PIH1D1/2/3 CS-like domain-containing protein n=1 Tax=Cymbomonas tetramitiformis TaxID=36881 RepID=A0AAE0GLR3_9CHLO|nr:hypothetical protein CYMTET_11805 [Cymbomonas tetramitiformis]